MAQLTTRTTSAPGATAKGSPLTNAEVDQNFNRLNKAGPQIRPSLLLDFANSESVDNRITFTRASAATRYDSNGVLQTLRNDKPRIDFDPVTGECKGLLIEEQRTNYFRRSSSFIGLGTGNGWHADGANIIVTQYAAIAPDGTMSAAKVERRNNGAAFVNYNHFAQNWTVGSGVPNANAWTFSLWLRSGTGSSITLTLSISGVSVTTTSQNITVSTEWQRYSLSIPAGTIGAGSADIGGGFNLTLNDSVFVWGGQMEIGSFATSHIPTVPTFTSRASSATYFDSTGVLRTAGPNQARYGFGYDSASGKWVSQGLVLESAATNLVIRSDMQANWSMPNVGYTYSTETTAPDGSTIRSINKNSTYQVLRLTAFDAGAITYPATFTFSFWAKTLSGTGSLAWDIGDSATANGTAALTTSWQRFTYTVYASSSATFPSGGFIDFSIPDNSTYAIWGVQLEAGATATSLVPTYGSTATRAADVSSSAAATRAGDQSSMTGTNFSSWWNNSQHSVFAEAETFHAGADYMIAECANDVSSIVEMSLTLAGSASARTQYINRLVGSNNDIRSAGGAYQANTFIKVAGSGSKTATLGGVAGVSGASVANQSISIGANQLMIGQRKGGSLYLNGHLKKLAFWNRALTQTELNAVTQ
jgi:hypothetical protein